MTLNRLQQCLLNLGLKQTEVESLTYDEAIQYLRFHHRKNWELTNILFLGFSETEETTLNEKAKRASLKVKKQLGSDLDFICISELAPTKRKEKAESYQAIIISKGDFELVFDNSSYSLCSNKMLYDFSIPKDFRITKPLSNFNQDIEIESFSFDNENTYIVNLFKTTCSCNDFEKKERSQYPKGDIRRLCKHLIDGFKNSFGTTGLSDLNKFIIEEGHPVKKNIYSFNIENVLSPISVYYDSKEDWWNIFMRNDKGLYCRYGYSSSEKRFANNEKPIGLAPALRNKLDEMDNRIFTKNNSNSKIKSSVKSPKGCASIIVAILSIGIFIYLIF